MADQHHHAPPADNTADAHTSPMHHAPTFPSQSHTSALAPPFVRQRSLPKSDARSRAPRTTNPGRRSQLSRLVNLKGLNRKRLAESMPMRREISREHRSIQHPVPVPSSPSTSASTSHKRARSPSTEERPEGNDRTSKRVATPPPTGSERYVGPVRQRNDTREPPCWACWAHSDDELATKCGTQRSNGETEKGRCQECVMTNSICILMTPAAYTALAGTWKGYTARDAEASDVARGGGQSHKAGENDASQEETEADLREAAASSAEKLEGYRQGAILVEKALREWRDMCSDRPKGKGATNAGGESVQGNEDGQTTQAPAA